MAALVPPSSDGTDPIEKSDSFGTDKKAFKSPAVLTGRPESLFYFPIISSKKLVGLKERQYICIDSFRNDYFK